MKARTFFRKIKKLWTDLNNELAKISEVEENIVLRSEKSLIVIDEITRKVKLMTNSFNFESIADEVTFFKTLKPLFISKYIYFSRILNIETSKPKAGHKELRKYYENELLKLKQYFIENKDFHIYYHRNASYLDHKYFVRKSYDLKMELPNDLYNFDENFTTSHDIKIAQIMANEYLEVYLLNSINISTQLSSGNIFSKFPLIWSASKVSLIELLYALHQTKCFNGGNIDFSEVVKATEKLLELDLGNYYKTIGEIKNRKKGRTKFLQLLNDNLNQLFLDSDQ